MADAVRAVVQVHTRYRMAGGEDRVVEAERVLLEGAGIEVTQVIFDNADLDDSGSLLDDAHLAASAIWSRSAQRHVSTVLSRHRPEIMHVHNTFAAASPSIYWAARASGAGVVQTLHNYRLVCPAATAFRDGRPCTDCVGKAVPWPAIAHACVRGSRGQSSVAAATLAMHKGLGTFKRRVDLYIALTAFQRRLMVGGGVAPDQIVVIPNFLDRDPGEGAASRSSLLFVGRLSEEKGVAVLLDAASRTTGALKVAGEGPLARSAERAAAEGHIDYLGALAQDGVYAELRRSVALVTPSIWFEGFPVVILEAYAAATPVIASRIGSLAEIVEDGVTGLLVEPGDERSLADRIQWAIDHPDAMAAMGANARRRFETLYAPQAHLTALLQSYATARSRGG